MSATNTVRGSDSSSRAKSPPAAKQSSRLSDRSTSPVAAHPVLRTQSSHAISIVRHADLADLPRSASGLDLQRLEDEDDDDLLGASSKEEHLLCYFTSSKFNLFGVIHYLYTAPNLAIKDYLVNQLYDMKVQDIDFCLPQLW